MASRALHSPDETTNRGLTRTEAARRLHEYGPNVVSRVQRLRPVVAFIGKFKSPLLLILIGASGISFFLGAQANGAIILFMVLLSGTLDFVNSYKSERAAELLNAKVVTTATVVRDGIEQEVELRLIVPGDIVRLSAGDIVPADSEVLEARDFFVNQSALTGEAFPVERAPRTSQDADASDPQMARYRVFLGTSVVTGYATVRVLVTGSETAFGKIAERTVQADQESDFSRGIGQFSFFIMRITLVLVMVVFFINAFLEKGIFDSFLFAVAIAVGLTPELLPVIMTVAMSHGSLRMAHKEVIVKHLPAIQNLGSMNILCTDKTGTLTENRIEVVKYVDVLGKESALVRQASYLTSMFHTGVQNPFDEAIRRGPSAPVGAWRKVDEVPFDFARRRDTMIVEERGVRRLITKGAPEDIFAVATQYQSGRRTVALTAAMRKRIRGTFDTLSAEGFRVLAIADRVLHDARSVYAATDERNLAILGFIAFLDPPKISAIDTIRELESLGIEIKVLTGDSELLTEKICRDISLPIKGVLSGSDVRALSDAELDARVPETTVFARILPEDKERVIASLRRLGNSVGYLGDGINDAPALMGADVGISVNNAVDVAKESADIILLRKSLHVLKDGVIEGRRTFQNTLKYVMMGMSSNFGNMISMTGISFFLPFLPMLPAQILLNNFMYDLSQATLPADRVDAHDIQRPVRWNLPFIKRFMLVFGPISSIFDFIAFAVLGLVFSFTGALFQTGWFMISLATQVAVVYVIRTRRVPFMQSSPSAPVLVSTVGILLAAWVLPYTPLAQVFGFAPLPITALFAAAVIVVGYLIVAEATKRVFYRMHASATG